MFVIKAILLDFDGTLEPHPKGVITALSLLDVKNSEAMFIGDSDADIQAGVQANVYTVGAQWLSDYQTMEFSIAPHAMFNSAAQFLDSLKIGVPYEL